MTEFLTVQLTKFAVACTPAVDGAKKAISFLKFPTWYQYLDCKDVAGKPTPQIAIDNPGQLALIALALVEILLRVAGIVAIGFVIYAGFQFILTQGEPERAAAARNTAINAIIGLAIAISAAGIVTFVAHSIAK